MRYRAFGGTVLAALLLAFTQAHAQIDPLPSWNDGPTKKAIVEFVQVTTDKASPTFVAPEARIATFDQPEGIHLMIGRRPHAAFGNSTGDRQMLEYTGAGDGARLMMLVLHDDAVREYAYGPAQGLPNSKVGTFTQALYDEAMKKGWIVISMKNDWKRTFEFDK
jgi:hypothetical protein